MDGPPRKRPEKALALLAHAVISTRPQTPSAATACNIHLTLARDFIVHAPPQDVAASGFSLTRAEFEVQREAALSAIRAQCAVCGLCARVGLKAP